MSIQELHLPYSIWTGFKPGDQVFGMGGFHSGSYAEKVCWPCTVTLVTKPANLTFEEAAALPYGGLLASSFLRRLDVQKGQRLLVYGVSGAIGTSAVQLARHLGAEVTGVCSTANVELVRSLGAAAMIDYTRDDFTKAGPFDIVFDAVGRRKSAAAIANARSALALGRKTDVGRRRLPEDTDLRPGHAQAAAESGDLRPVIDRVYPLTDIVEAHRYVDQGHKKGNVIVTVTRQTDPQLIAESAAHT